jgi:hypothetical protein
MSRAQIVPAHEAATLPADPAICRFADAKPESDVASLVAPRRGCGNSGTLAAQTPSPNESAIAAVIPPAWPMIMNCDSIPKDAQATWLAET